MKKLFFTICIIIFVMSAYSQGLNWQWAQAGGASNQDYAKDIITDGEGNSYVTGSYNTIGVFGDYTLLSGFSNDNMFLVKYNAEGTEVWAKSAGATSYSPNSSRHTWGNSVALYNQYVYVTGETRSTSTAFDDDTMTGGTGEQKMFLAKYDTSGNTVWQRQLIGYGNDDGDSDGLCVETDNQGNVFVGGSYWKDSQFENTPTILDGESAWFSFIAKYDANGNLLWVKRFNNGSNNYNYINGIKTDNNGNIFITGSFNSGITFEDGNSLTETVTGSSYYLVKYSSDGTFGWSKGFYQTGAGSGNGVGTDSDGNCYVAGTFSGTVSFNANPNPNPTLISFGLTDGFIAKYSSAGTCLWAKKFGGTGQEVGEGVAVDESGNSFVCGTTGSSTCNFNGSILNTSGFNAVVAKYDSLGNVILKKSELLVYSIPDISYDINGSIYIAGGFENTNGVFGSINLTNSGQKDSYISKLACSSASLEITTSGNIEFCEGSCVTLTANSSIATDISWSNGATTPSIEICSAGDFTFSQETDGCSYISETISTIVNQLPTQPTITQPVNNILYTTSPADIYQWLESGNNIPNANTSNYTVGSTGYYQIMITDINGCSSISDSLFVLITSMNDMNTSSFSIYPNPTTTAITLEITLVSSSIIQTEIKNSLGQTVYSNNEKALSGLYKKTLDINLGQGIYFLSLQTNEGLTTKKLEIIK